MVYYKSYRIIDGKPKWVLEDEDGNIINRNPCKVELKGLEKFPEKDGRSSPRLKKSNNELLEYLRQFEKENGRINLMYYLKNKDFFGIKDIKKWLGGGT
jgi:hypothetical protein